jgi:GTP-binding protein
MPVVAIVGRPNVGKSSLLNALSGKRIAIVQDMPGVTRDRVAAPVDINGRFVEMVDTGGYGFDDPDQLTEHIREQIEIAMSRAQLVLFVVDCQDGLTAVDQEVAALLRRQGVKTILLANKADGERADVALAEFARMGLGTPIGVSAMNGRNIDVAITAIEQNVDLSDAPERLSEPELLLAIVGKRNAGKSTLVNAVASIYEDDPNRMIVSEVPGTTRDSVDVRFEKDGKTLVVIDTAGVRKKRHMVTDDIQYYSFHRAQRSIRRADVVLMLIDGTEPLSDPDRKLGQYIAEQFKPVVLVVNKWDLTRQKVREVRNLKPDERLDDQRLMDDYAEYLAKEMPWLDYAPVAFTTAKDGRNIQAVLDLAAHLKRQSEERLTTSRLNEVMEQIIGERQPATPTGGHLRIFYATQVDTAPPTIVLFVNHPEYVNDSYERFVLHRMRELLPYAEVPIKLHFRGRKERQAEEEKKSRP